MRENNSRNQTIVKVIKKGIADMKGRSSSKMKVFEPFKINQMELKNRMVVSAMVTNYCSEDGMATEKIYCLS